MKYSFALMLCLTSTLAACVSRKSAVSEGKIVPAGQARPPGEHVLTCHTPFGQGPRAPQPKDYHSLLINKVEDGFYAEVRRADGNAVTLLPVGDVIDRAAGTLSQKNGKIEFASKTGRNLGTLTYEGLAPIESTVAALQGDEVFLAEGKGTLMLAHDEVERSLDCLFSAPSASYEVK